MATFQKGDRPWFEYHCYEGEDSSDAEAWHRTHQRVTVLRQLPLSQADPAGDGSIRMYQVRFDDGLEYSVYDDELMRTRRFTRPDYVK